MLYLRKLSSPVTSLHDNQSSTTSPLYNNHASNIEFSNPQQQPQIITIWKKKKNIYVKHTKMITILISCWKIICMQT
jgi:hypothetical protein